jgi:ABC-type multidrug transport system fused ATPase/permease subunit
MDRLREVLDAPPQTEPPLPAGLPPRLRGAVEFTDVHFAHSDGTVALRGLSLRLEPGTSLALIGPPGAGKSTLVRLLLRFDDPSAGTIALDGHDLRTLPRSYVRAQVAAALQEPYLYSRTINENLRFAAPSRSAEELREAAREASIATSIESFELAYETRVGERGVNLSGGQRQRISLARTLLVDAPVLVLDDTVSAVDTHTEREILAALAARRGRVTTLLIAHRLSTVRAADQIAVLDQGRVVQLGSHEQLSQVEGPYRRLWRIQTDQDRELVADLAPGVSQP